MFRQAERKQSKLRMTIDGPAGSGKTYTALRFAHVLANGGRIALIDTERGSASKYVGESPDGIPFNFMVAELQQFSPERYTEAIIAAGRNGFDVLVIDSLSHAWEGAGGALEMKQKAGESWSAWRAVTPIHNRMIDAILQSPMHIITTMRSRMEYVQETDERTNKVTIRKVGLAPIQRPGMEYEFDLVCEMDWTHTLTVSKSRCPSVADMIVDKPGGPFIQNVSDWLYSGKTISPQPLAKQPTEVLFTEPAPQQPVGEITLDDLDAMFGMEKILEANGGKIPATQEEVNAIAKVLL